MTNYKKLLKVLFSYRRNIKDMPFVKALSDKEQAIGITRALAEIFGEDFEFKALKNQELLRCIKLEEKGEITQELIENKDISAYGKSFSFESFVYVNEQDHIRIETRSKNDLEYCYTELNKLDDLVLDKLEMCFSTKYGYLTQNPMLCGTGLEMQAYLFLPAIVYGGQVNQLNSLVGDEFELCEFGGTPFSGKCALCTLKNKYTFGYKENEFAEKFKKLIDTILLLEENEENKMFEISASSLVNHIYISYGVLSNAYRLTFKEALKQFCDVAWGLNLNILKGNFNLLEQVAKIKPQHLSQGKQIDMKEEEKLRARVCNNICANIKKGEVDV